MHNPRGAGACIPVEGQQIVVRFRRLFAAVKLRVFVALSEEERGVGSDGSGKTLAEAAADRGDGSVLESVQWGGTSLTRPLCASCRHHLLPSSAASC